MDDRVAALRGVPLFAGLDERSLQAVAVLGHPVDARAGDVLILEGEPGESFYVIVDGTVRVEHRDRTVRSLTAGGFLGEIALVEHGPRTATATCVSDCRLLEILATSSSGSWRRCRTSRAGSGPQSSAAPASSGAGQLSAGGSALGVAAESSQSSTSPRSTGRLTAPEPSTVSWKALMSKRHPRCPSARRRSRAISSWPTL